MKLTLKKFISIAAAFLVLLSSLGCLSLAAYESDYPEGVTPQQALAAVDSTDRLIASALMTFTGSDLKATVSPMLYNSQTLSTVLVSIYGAFGEKTADMKSLGIDVSPAGVANGLAGYPAVNAALAAAPDWASVSLENVDWGVTDKQGFLDAVAASLSPLNDMLFMLLCSGSVKISIITVDGGNGYENAIVPLLKALCCENIMPQADFTAAASQNKNAMVVNILEPVLALLDKICEAPADTLSTVLPSVADYIQGGGFDGAMDAIMQPIKENRLVEIATFLRILDLDSLDFNMGDMLTGSLGDMASQGGLELGELDIEGLAACGENKDSVFTADKGKAFIHILRYLIDALKLNADKLPEMLAQADTAPANAMLPEDMLESLMKVDTDTLIKVLFSLFEPQELPAAEAMVYPAYSPAQVQYTANLTRENFEKDLSGTDEFLNEFIKESAGYNDAATLLAVNVYSNANVSSLLLGIYPELEKQGLSDALKILNIDISPAGVAALLTEKDYAAVKNALSKAQSWSGVSLDGVRWGFYEGSRKGFENALTASLRPLFPLLRFLLAGEDIELLDSIKIKGGDGYNTAVIPLLEGLGCAGADIKSYSQYRASASTDSVIKDILNPLFSLLDGVFARPVDKLTSLLPNLAYFMTSGSLEKILSNLLLPLGAVTNTLEPVYKLDFDTSSLTSELDINKLASSLTSSAGIKLPGFDLKKLASLGTLTQRQSKSVINGAAQQYSYIQADKPAVFITVLRFLIDALKMPENADALSGLMSGGMNDAMAAYSGSMFTELDSMTTDETVEWLHNLLFKERVRVELEKSEPYSPTIIYKEEKESHTLQTVLGCVGGAWVISWIVVLCNRKKFFDT